MLDIDQELNVLYGRDKDDVVSDRSTFWATWWLFLEPDMDDIYKKSGDCLDKWLEEKEISVVKIEDKQYIFLARFEWREYGKNFSHADGLIEGQKQDDVPVFVDFLSGLSWDAIEILTSIRDASMGKDDFALLQADNDASPTMPSEIFEGYKAKSIYWNYLWLVPDETKKFLVDHAENLKQTAEPENIHDWFRLNVQMTDKFPVPGEFMGLAVRIFPAFPWGDQDSNPFIFSGNFMDTAYNLRGRITEIIEETDTRPYKLYKVKTHFNEGEEITICATDFMEYNVDDYITIVKDVNAIEEKDVFNWEDDKVVVDEDTWQIVPTTYYDLDDQDSE